MTNVYPVKILAALNEIMGSVSYVQKQGKNAFHNYKYAGEGHLLEVLRPAMVKAGLLLIPSHRAVTPPDEYGNTTVTIDYTLAHKDGEVWPEKITVVGCGNDKNSKGGVGDKGIYKAATGANKYLLFKLFQIETGDDPEKDSEHDKDGTPVKQTTDGLPAVKNAPGVAKARTWVSEFIRDAMACESAEQFRELVIGTRTHWVRICAVYPNIYAGPDGSGLRGEVQKIATIMEARPAFDAFVTDVEAAAAEVNKPQAAE